MDFNEKTTFPPTENDVKSPGTETVKCFYGFNFLQKWEIDPLKILQRTEFPIFIIYLDSELFL